MTAIWDGLGAPAPEPEAPKKLGPVGLVKNRASDVVVNEGRTGAECLSIPTDAASVDD